MPADIAMCRTSPCPLKATCHRSPASGQRPTEYRQAYIEAWPEAATERCHGYIHVVPDPVTFRVIAGSSV